MACSANQEQVFLPLDQSAVSNFALIESKIKKENAHCFDQSAFSNFAFYVTPIQFFATAFSQISLFLDTHGNTISRENLNSGSHEHYAKHETV